MPGTPMHASARLYIHSESNGTLRISTYYKVRGRIRTLSWSDSYRSEKSGGRQAAWKSSPLTEGNSVSSTNY